MRRLILIASGCVWRTSLSLLWSVFSVLGRGRGKCGLCHDRKWIVVCLCPRSTRGIPHLKVCAFRRHCLHSSSPSSFCFDFFAAERFLSSENQWILILSRHPLPRVRRVGRRIWRRLARTTKQRKYCPPHAPASPPRQFLWPFPPNAPCWWSLPRPAATGRMTTGASWTPSARRRPRRASAVARATAAAPVALAPSRSDAWMRHRRHREACLSASRPPPSPPRHRRRLAIASRHLLQRPAPRRRCPTAADNPLSRSQALPSHPPPLPSLFFVFPLLTPHVTRCAVKSI